MKKRLLVAFSFSLTPILFAQTNAATLPPSDPDPLLRAAAPFYDYASPDMKPWHIRYHYQSFDLSGQPDAEGTFDYWHSAEKGSKSVWTQADQSNVQWRTAANKVLELPGGTSIPSMPHRLSWVMTPAFLTMKDSPSEGRQLEHFTTKTSTTELECVGSVRTAAPNNTPPSFGVVWPTYCFLKGQPVLTASHENGSLINVYGKVQKFQDHYFPGDIEIFYVGKKRLVATLEELKEVPAEDEAFTPSPDAKEPPPPEVIVVPKGGNIQLPSLIHRVEPIFPQSYIAMRKEGTVVLSALIGKDGNVKDARIISSPDAALSAAALDAVRQWKYEPATMNGQPADLNTTITLNFAVKH